MFAATYPEFALAAPKPGFDLALEVNVDVITPTNAGMWRLILKMVVMVLLSK